MAGQSDADAGPSTFEVAVAELVRVFEPMVEAVDEGPMGVVELLDDSGVAELLVEEELAKVVTTVDSEIAEPVTQLRGLLGGQLQLQPGDVRTILQSVSEFDPSNPDPAALLDGVEQLTEPIDSIILGVQTLSELEFEHEDLDDAGERLLNYLLVRYLEENRPHAHRVLRLVNVVEIPDGADPLDDGVLEPANLEAVFTDPKTTAAEALNWGQGDFRDDLLVDYLAKLFGLLGVFTRVEPPVTTEQAELVEGIISNNPNRNNEDFEKELGDQLAVPVVRTPNGAFGFRIVPVPDFSYTGPQGDAEYYPGLALVPYGPFDEFGAPQFSQSLGDDWTFDADFRGELEKYGLLVQPRKPEGSTTDFQFRPLDAAGGANPLDEAQASAGVTYEGSSDPEDYLTVLGAGDGTRVDLGTVAAETSVTYEDGEFSISVDLPTEGKVVIKPSGGFLTKVLPDEMTSDFEVTTGWSMADGMYFDGGATLAVPIPLHQQVGPIEIKEVYLSLGFDAETGRVTARAAASAAIELGPVSGTVERTGVDATLSFPDDRDGTFGVADLELGFKPPKGVALSVGSGPVSGSGYLFFEPETERYRGYAQLTVSQISVTAVGLITTELPDGSDGFSMQVIVAGQFPPVQLGFGFTLVGVGGLLGINRQFRKRPLRNVVRKGTLDSVLFPKRETLKNQPQRIISDIRSIFPPKRQSYLFGPMVKLGYGTPAVLESSLGIVLEIPSFRVVIVGRFELVLPNHEAEKPSGMPEQAPFPPIVLNLDVVGIIDIPGKSISIDATLYDSRLLQWSVSGDMALRASWGETSRFILSVGGFNPRYTPPKDAPGLQKLDRVQVSLDVPSGQPVVNFTGYFAVTSNTFQVGGTVYAELSAGNLDIWGRLGFHALFEFEPFRFIFDFLAEFVLKGPSFKLRFKFDATIKGPNPFNINGTVKLQAGPVEVNKRFAITIGPEQRAEQLPPAEVLAELRDALTRPKNWSAQRPPDGESFVSLTRPEPGGGEESESDEESPVLVHPRAELTVRQSVVPLEYEIEKFGENAPKTYDAFAIRSVSVAGGTPDVRRPAMGEFAPAKFTKMSDVEKLSRPDFVDRTAGTTVGPAAPVVGGAEKQSNSTRASFVYEERVEDDGLAVTNRPVETMQSGGANPGKRTHTAHTATSLVEGRSSVSGPDGGRFDVSQEHPPDEDDGTISVDPVEYIVVDESDFTVVADPTVPSDGGVVPLSREEARGKIETLARETDRDPRSLTVMRKDRFENAPWRPSTGRDQ